MPKDQPAHVDATFYAQVEPRWARPHPYWDDASGNPHLEGAAVIALTQSRPRKPRSGVVVTKLTLRLPASAFLPLQPEAIVVVPSDMIELGSVIEVQASDPRDPDAVDPVVAQ